MIGGTEVVVIRCRVNGALGADRDYQNKPAGRKKHVVVVGGGPAGMETARVLAIRGHQVTLFEKEKRLGGLLPWVAMVKGLDKDYDVTIIANRLENRITKLGVDIHLEEEFQPSMVSQINPDVIVLAPGGVPTLPDIPGIDENTIALDDLYLQIKDDLGLIAPSDLREMGYYWDTVGEKVVIIGGTIEGTALAEYLADRCRDVSVVDEGDIYGTGMMPAWDYQKVTTLSNVTYKTITETGLKLRTKEGDKKTLEAETIITATSPRPNTELLKAFEGMAPEVYLVGEEDEEPSSIMNAIGNGFWLAQGI